MKDKEVDFINKGGDSIAHIKQYHARCIDTNNIQKIKNKTLKRRAKSMIQVSKKKKIYWFSIVALILAILAVSELGMRRNHSAFREVPSPEILYTYSDAEVFIGRDDCPACQAAMNILGPVLEEENREILYFNTKFMEGT